MPKDTNRRPDNATGRKRDEKLTGEILKAAAELLLEVGFDRLRTQDVAERAGAGKGAIYRRWATKEALLAEAIRNMPVADPQITDDPIADLRTLVSDRCHSAANKPDLVPGLISAMRSDAGIKEAVAEGYSLDHIRHAIGRVVGADHPHLNLLTDLTQAIPLHRSAFTPESVNAEAMTDEIMSHIQSVADLPNT